ncbi:MAG TPA: TlpA family protein disulfide reductase [Hydrogenothermaceae bacterium]|nr:TlpA family protein disulfide reductase [Hydrogenothermaceae bacterium]
MRKFIKVLSISLFVFSISFAGLKKIPNFELKREDGKIISREDLKGKPSILVFWSLNCSSCKEELPILNKFYHKYKNKINFYAIVLFTNSIEKVKQRKKEWGFDIPVLLGGNDNKIVYKYRVIGVPTTYFINKDLTIFKLVYGKKEEEKLEKIIDELLKRNLQ